MNPTQEVPPGQVLLLLFPPHQACVGADGAAQVPSGGVTVQLFCPTELKLLSATTAKPSANFLIPISGLTLK